MPNDPRILEKNYLNSDDTIVSSGGGTIANLYDSNPLTYLETSGANDDDTDAILTITFNEGSAATTRHIDFIALLDHNIKSISFEHDDGGSGWTSWFDLTDLTTTPAGAATDLVLDLRDHLTIDDKTVNAIRIKMHSTQTADQEKKVAGIILTEAIVDPGGMNNYQVKPRQKVRTLTFGDNSMMQVMTTWASDRSQKYEATASWTQMDDTTWKLLELLKESGRSFSWYPEPVELPDRIYQVIWTATLMRKYSTAIKTLGVDVQMELKEI